MIDVIVPTFNRPTELERAVHSLFDQTIAAEGFRIIIVDNTPEQTAKLAIKALRAACPVSIELCVLHEPSPGVANARNKAMEHVKTELIAFLDDDQTAPNDWLASLIRAHEKYPAAIVFGPVWTRLPDETIANAAYFKQFFARDPGLPTGFIDESFGCGNALIERSKIPGALPWFNTKMNETGGEDDLLFDRVRLAGGTFAWAAEAPVWEHPPLSRVRLGYTLRRAFSFGQGPITVARQPGNRRPLHIAAWMAIGATKAVWHLGAWVALSAIRHPSRAAQLDRAVRGIAKVFWWIEFRLYGQSALQTARDNRTTGLEQALENS